MRKKHDEGYALVFVLVVVLVLSGIAIALMTGALRNLQAQTAAVERMQAKYQAQGEVEKAISMVEAMLDAKTLSYSSIEPLAYVQQEVSSWIIEKIGVTTDDITWQGNTCIVTLTKEKAVGDVRAEIVCKVELLQVIKEDFVEAGRAFLIQNPQIQYNAYTISYTDISESSEGGATG